MSKRILLTVALAGLLAGCAGCAKIPVTRYYAIDTHLPAMPAIKTLPLDVVVARFRAPSMLIQDRVVYRSGQHQVNYYNYDRWNASPADMVTNALVRGLQDSRLFRSVSAAQGGKVDYLLRGYLERLEEVDNADSVTARVALRMEVVDMKTNAVVWSGNAAAEQPVAERSVDGVVRALNEGIQQGLQEIIRGLEAHFQK